MLLSYIKVIYWICSELFPVCWPDNDKFVVITIKLRMTWDVNLAVITSPAAVSMKSQIEHQVSIIHLYFNLLYSCVKRP